MSAASLPYENATSGKAAVEDMRKLLQQFGASSFGCMEDFGNGEVIVQFAWRERQVTMRCSAKGYAAAWLRVHPYTHRMRLTEAQHRARAMQQAQVSVYSILRDWLRGQITAVEVGMLSFDGAFLGNLMLPDGSTVLERITDPKRGTPLLKLEGPRP